MPADKRRIEPADIMPSREYAARRKELRQARIANKAARRLQVGPYATVLFESYGSMLAQVQEMLFIEKGGPAQIPDELAAYNPLIPQGSELVATIMFEIDDPLRRARVLGSLGGVERHAFIRVGTEMIRGVEEGDQERSREDGKASAVQFVRFAFTPAQIAAFRGGGGDVVVGFDHPNYGHMALMSPEVRQALAQDFA